MSPILYFFLKQISTFVMYWKYATVFFSYLFWRARVCRPFLCLYLSSKLRDVWISFSTQRAWHSKVPEVVNCNKRRHDMNGRSQMQGGKNWILPKKTNANQFFWDSHWLEIWKNKTTYVPQWDWMEGTWLWWTKAETWIKKAFRAHSCIWNEQTFHLKLYLERGKIVHYYLQQHWQKI